MRKQSIVIKLKNVCISYLDHDKNYCIQQENTILFINKIIKTYYLRCCFINTPLDRTTNHTLKGNHLKAPCMLHNMYIV